MKRQEFYDRVQGENLIQYFVGDGLFCDDPISIEQLYNILICQEYLKLGTRFVDLHTYTGKENSNSEFVLAKFGGIRDLHEFLYPGLIFYSHDTLVDCEEDGLDMVYRILSFNHMQEKINNAHLQRMRLSTDHVTEQMIKEIPFRHFEMITDGTYCELRQAFMVKSYGDFHLDVKKIINHRYDFSDRWELSYDGYDPIYENLTKRFADTDYKKLFLMAEGIYQEHQKHHQKDIDEYYRWMSENR